MSRVDVVFLTLSVLLSPTGTALSLRICLSGSAESIYSGLVSGRQQGLCSLDALIASCKHFVCGKNQNVPCKMKSGYGTTLTRIIKFI